MDLPPLRVFGAPPSPFHAQLGALVPTPVGMPCCWCDEPFVAGDYGLWMPTYLSETMQYQPWHRECFMRTIFGSAEHQRQECRCYGASETKCDGALVLSKREEAKRAVEIFEAKGRKP